MTAIDSSARARLVGCGDKQTASFIKRAGSSNAGEQSNLAVSRRSTPQGVIAAVDAAPPTRPLGRDLHRWADYVFLGLVFLSAGCFSALATLPLFLLGLLMATYFAFKLTAPSDEDDVAPLSEKGAGAVAGQSAPRRLNVSL